MSHNFKRPKTFLHQGSPEARIRKYARTVLNSQAAIDAYISQMPPAMRDVALENIKPYLSPELLSSLDKVEVEACES